MVGAPAGLGVRDERGGGGWLVLAWTASVVLIAADTLTAGRVPVGAASRFGLALLPWLLVAGLPQRARARTGLLPLALAVPPLCAGFGLDHARGLELGRSISIACIALGLVVVWGLAARAAGERANDRAARVYGWLWLALVMGAPALAVALRWAPLGQVSASAPASSPWVEWMTRCSPLVWGFELAREGASSAQVVPGGCLALGVGLCAWALAAALARSEPEETEGASA